MYPTYYAPIVGTTLFALAIFLREITKGIHRAALLLLTSGSIGGMDRLLILKMSTSESWSLAKKSTPSSKRKNWI